MEDLSLSSIQGFLAVGYAISEPFYWKDGKIYNLQRLLPKDTAWRICTVFDINDKSEILCSAVPRDPRPSSPSTQLLKGVLCSSPCLFILEPVKTEEPEYVNPPEVIDLASLYLKEVKRRKKQREERLRKLYEEHGIAFNPERLKD